MMVEWIGGPEKLRAAANHTSLKSTVNLVELCCSRATNVKLDGLHSRAVDTLQEIMCHCCHCSPEYLLTIRDDSLLRITELHRERFRNFTPSTLVYTGLCGLLHSIVMTADAPQVGWATKQRRSQRTRKPMVLSSLERR